MTKKEKKALRCWFVNNGPYHPEEAKRWIKCLWPNKASVIIDSLI